MRTFDFQQDLIHAVKRVNLVLHVALGEQNPFQINCHLPLLTSHQYRYLSREVIDGSAGKLTLLLFRLTPSLPYL